jgi:hypothetical protein
MSAANPIPSVQSQRRFLDALVVFAATCTVLVALLFGPLYAIAGLVVLGLAGMVLSRPELGAVAAVFALFVNLAPTAARFYGVPQFAALGIFLLLAIPALYHVVGRREPVRTDGVFLWMFIFLLVRIASIIFSHHPDESWVPLQFFLLEGMLVYFLVLNAVRTCQALRQCVMAMVLAGALLGGLSLLQNITGSYQSQFGGFALTRTKNALGEIREARMPVTDPQTGKSITRSRAMGPVGDPNYYGQLLTIVLPAAVLFIWAERGMRKKLAAAAAAACILGGIALTFSRGAALAVVAVVVALVLLKYIRLRYAIPVAIAACLLLMASPDYTSRMRSLAGMSAGELRSADRSAQERATLARAGANVFLDYPLLGVGVGQSKQYLSAYATMGGYSRPRRFKAAHNTYLELLVETGVLGFLAFVGIVYATARALWRMRTFWRVRRPEYAHLLSGLLLGIVGFLVTGLFLDLAYARFFWGLLALCGAASYILREQALELSRQPRALVAVRVARL